MNNTIPNVPRDLLAELQEHIDCHRDAVLWGKVCDLLSTTSPTDHVEGLRAMVAAPSPAGVDGLEVVSNWVLFDAEADKPYIKKMLPEGFLAFFDCEEDARRAKANNHGTDYKRIDRVKAEDAQAIIDGLRGEVYDEAKERALFEAAFRTSDLAGAADYGRWRYTDKLVDYLWYGWLACARSRAKAAGCE